MKVEVLFYKNSEKVLFRITTKETILILEEAETKKLFSELSKAFRSKPRALKPACTCGLKINPVGWNRHAKDCAAYTKRGKA